MPSKPTVFEAGMPHTSDRLERIWRNRIAPFNEGLDADHQMHRMHQTMSRVVNPKTQINCESRGPIMFSFDREERRASMMAESPGNPISRPRKIPDHLLDPESRMQVWDGDNTMHIIDFFSNEDWVAQHDVTTSHKPLDSNLNVPELKKDSQLTPWQDIGAKKLSDSCQYLLRGLIVGDETGLGKSLMALAAALHQRNEMLPNCGPVAIVTRHGCVLQWYEEIERHFNKQTRPKAMILDVAETPISKIMEHDIIIFSSNFLKQRFRDIETQILWSNTVESEGIYRARQLFAKHKPKKVHQPLHSRDYWSLNRLFPVLIVDEVHDAKNPESLYHRAILKLPYHNAFLLTATPIFNTWHDIGGILLLLPGSPFKSIEEFRRVFPIPPSYQGEVGRKGPQGPFLKLLKHFLSGIILARPKSVLKLSPVKKHYEMITERLPRVVDLLIIEKTSRAEQLIWGENVFPPGHPGRDGQMKRGIQLLRIAQQLANHETLLNPYDNYAEGKQWRKEYYSQFEEKLCFDIQVWLGDRDATNLTMPISLENLTATQYGGFKQWYTHQFHSTETDTDEDSPQYSKASQFQKDANRGKAHTWQVTQGPARDGLREAHQAMYEDENFIYNQDEEDADFDPDNSDYDANAGKLVSASNTTAGYSFEYKRKKQNIESERIWEETVQTMSIEELGSPKVKRVTDVITHIQSEYPSEKIITASASVKFLDILRKYLEHRLPALKTKQFDGRIKSLAQRMEIAKRFNSKSGDIDLLLLSASCGGTGLNLHGGSHVIITERFWTPGLEHQVIGRADRLNQQRQVHVYYVCMETKVDYLIEKLLDKKRDAASPLETTFRRGYDVPYVPGRLPTRSEVESEMEEYNKARQAAARESKRTKRKHDAIDKESQGDEDEHSDNEGEGNETEEPGNENEGDENGDSGSGYEGDESGEDEEYRLREHRRETWYNRYPFLGGSCGVEAMEYVIDR